MDIFALLKQDHLKVETLFVQLLDNEKTSDNKKVELVEALKVEIKMHSELEERLFYPLLETKDETWDLMDEAFREHLAIKAVLEKLELMTLDHAKWNATLKDLRKKVRHHVNEEEQKIFPKAMRVLSDAEIDELAHKFKLEKDKLVRSHLKEVVKSGRR